MLINSVVFQTGGQCTRRFEQPQGWLRATWSGYVTPNDALNGALNYLAQAGPFRAFYFLHDATSLQGPWFNSVEWLNWGWLPQAFRLGLRYIAHVVRANKRQEVLTINCLAPAEAGLKLPFFGDPTSAQEWLRAYQQPVAARAWPPQLLRTRC